jgi:hypothetical protein
MALFARIFSARRNRRFEKSFNVSAILEVAFRWLFKDRTLLCVYLKMSMRNRIAAFIMRRRFHGKDSKKEFYDKSPVNDSPGFSTIKDRLDAAAAFDMDIAYPRERGAYENHTDCPE